MQQEHRDTCSAKSDIDLEGGRRVLATLCRGLRTTAGGSVNTIVHALGTDKGSGLHMVRRTLLLGASFKTQKVLQQVNPGTRKSNFKTSNRIK